MAKHQEAPKTKPSIAAMVKICKKLGVFWENTSNPVTPGPEERANQTHTEECRLLCKQQGTPQALLLKKPGKELRAAQTGVLSPHPLSVLKFLITALASCMESVVTIQSTGMDK